MADEKDIEANTKAPLEGDCVVPAKIPPEVATDYVVASDPHAEQDIANYVSGQARGETITHVEKIRTEHVRGEAYEIWDVATDENQWWVITNITNLYPKEYFPSLDFTLSFHIGVMHRMTERQEREFGREDAAPFEEIYRRREQAEDLLDKAIEAEQFQAVGMQLRECLILLMTAIRRRAEYPDSKDNPKAADFIGWSDALLNQMCAGSSNKELRQYVKSGARQTWQLVNWLTHSRSATQAASSIAMHGCDMIIGHFVQLLVRDRTDQTEICPKCSSREVRSHYDINIAPDGDYYSTCGSCRWSSHPEDTANG